MSSNENNSEVAVDKVGDEKTGDPKSDLKGAKRAAEVSAHVKLYVFVLDARHFIERYYIGHICVFDEFDIPRVRHDLWFAAKVEIVQTGVFLDYLVLLSQRVRQSMSQNIGV